jgi:hypothetical protein
MEAIMLGAALVSFFALFITWLVLPGASAVADESPSRVSVRRPSAAEA